MRLEATPLAQKLVGLAAIQAQSLGFHREKNVIALPLYKAEQVRRLWHTIYILDRRLAIDNGRPFLIQDHNIDTGLPHDVSDEWIEIHGSETGIEGDEHACVAESVQASETTPVGYLKAMSRFSNLTGRAWDTMYNAEQSQQTCSPWILKTFEEQISTWTRQLPPQLVWRGTSFEPSNAWQTRQRILIQVVSFVKTVHFSVLCH